MSIEEKDGLFEVFEEARQLVIDACRENASDKKMILKLGEIEEAIEELQEKIGQL